MNLSEGRLAPVPGAAGLVIRTSGAVLFVAARQPADHVRRLTDLVARAEGDRPARALARELAALVAADNDGSLPGFAVVAVSPGGTYVRVYGPVEVHLQGEHAEEVLTGVGSFTGIDREVAGPFHTITAAPAGQPVPPPVFDIDVQAGTAPGDGFSITTLSDPGDAPAGSPAAEAVAAAPEPDPQPEPLPEDEPSEATVPVDEPAPAPEPIVAPPAFAAAPEPESAPEPEVAPEPEPSVAPLDVEPAATEPLADPTPAPVAEVPGSDAPGSDASASEADAVAAMHVVSEPTPPEGDLDAPTQAWTPSTADFDADDVAVAANAQADAAPAPEPAWGSAEPDPGPSLEKPAEAPGTPTPLPAHAPPAAPAPSLEPTRFEDLPLADPLPEDEPAAAPPVADEPAPPAHEPATQAIPPAPAATDAPPAEFTSQLLGALDDEEPEERDALPVELDPSEVRQPDAPVTAEVQVQGVICSRGHFNDPRSRFCSSCGTSMASQTQILTPGPRPPLGVMVFEDGATFSLSTDYVVGRQPEVSDLVQQGLALPLPVDDPERSISRAHAELRLVDWDVHLVNLSGTNGSFVWDENGQQWVPIPEGQSVVLTPGMRVALGRRSAVFESSLVR